jgi:hypothetical protein
MRAENKSDPITTGTCLGRFRTPYGRFGAGVYSFLSVLQQDLQNFLHNNKQTTNTIITTRAIFISPPFPQLYHFHFKMVGDFIYKMRLARCERMEVLAKAA